MVVFFTIDKKDGRVKDAKIIRSMHSTFDQPLLDAVNAMPSWKPGSMNGKAVDVRMIIPFKIGLQ